MIFPSTAIFKKVGWVPLLGYVCCAIVGLYILLRYIFPAIAPRLSTRFCIGMTVAFFVILTVALALIYPQILEHQGFRLFGIQFGVSDSNDAFVATWRAMFEGKYPYYENSFLNNPISPMPGSLFIALPFYVLGSTAYQNIFWLVIFWVGLGKYLQDFRLASLIMLVVAAISPDLIYAIIQAGDYGTNGIYILLPALFLLHSVQQQRSIKWSLGAAAVLGLALSSRANFLLLGPLLFFALIRLRDFRFAFKHLLVALSVCALVTLPFFFYDPAHFSPLHTTGKLTLDGRFPHAAECVFFAGCLLATGLGFFLRKESSLESICARMFFVQEFAVLSGFLLASAGAHRIDLTSPHFALLSMFFGVFAFGPQLFHCALNQPSPAKDGSKAESPAATKRKAPVF